MLVFMCCLSCVFMLQVIVAVGGEDNKLVLRSVECFDPLAHSWRSLSCLPFAVRSVTHLSIASFIYFGLFFIIFLNKKVSTLLSFFNCKYFFACFSLQQAWIGGVWRECPLPGWRGVSWWHCDSLLVSVWPSAGWVAWPGPHVPAQVWTG